MTKIEICVDEYQSLKDKIKELENENGTLRLKINDKDDLIEKFKDSIDYLLNNVTKLEFLLQKKLIKKAVTDYLNL